MEEKDFLFSQMIPPDHQGVEEGGQGRRHLVSLVLRNHIQKKDTTYDKYIFDYFLHKFSLQDNTKLLDVICFYLIATLNRVHLKYMFEALSC